MAARADFIHFLTSQFPALKPDQLESMLAPHLLSEHVLRLPAAVLTQAQEFARAAFQLRSSAAYQKSLQARWDQHQLPVPPNQAILMSYDFHWVPGTGLRLIEINTNAAFLAMADALYAARNLPRPVGDFSMDEIRENIRNEYCQVTGKSEPQRVAIVDEKPEQQRLFVEFLLYQEHFKKWGWDTHIVDVADLNDSYDFIYNRCTDFYLATESARHLRQAFLSKKTAVSPQPYEYFLLADKARMIEWSRPGFLESVLDQPEAIAALRAGLPGAWELTPATAEELWSRRKTLFFKPQRAFGAKQSYKGASISKKVFETIHDHGFLAQEYVHAPETEVATPNGPQNFKYDLRFYAYRDRIQSVVGRLYQGQVTNLQTPLGGFTPVVWTP